MQLYLIQDVKKLGAKGDRVTVSDGYGRNFLLSRGLASMKPLPVSSPPKRSVLSKQAIAVLAQRAEAIRLNAAASAAGTLYRAVSATDIVAAIKEQAQVTIPATAVILSEPIKTVGDHQCQIENNGSTVVTVTLSVTPRGTA